MNTTGKNVYQCFECVADGMQIFDTEEELITHKWDMIKATKRGTHMSCHICKLDHRTLEGLVRHYQLNHPAKQQLNCPGCNKLFARLHLLIAHLDGDECPHILASRVSESRVLQVQATNIQAATSAAAGSTRGTSIIGAPADATSLNGHEVNSGLARPAEELPEQASKIISRSEELGIFDVSGVTTGDFGRFIGIDLNTVAAITTTTSATISAGNNKCSGHNMHYLMAEKASSSDTVVGSGMSLTFRQRRVAPTSAKAMEQMLHRQRMTGVGGVIETDTSAAQTVAHAKNAEDAKRKGKARILVIDEVNLLGHQLADAGLSQTTRDFRQGDAKGPDLLTDDTTWGGQRVHGTYVWAGQGMFPGGGGGGGESISAGPSAGGATTAAGMAGTTGLAGAAGRTAAFSVHDPDHPRFNINAYRHRVSGRYSCPHGQCRRAGKQFKTAGALMMHLRSDTAHTATRVQCPSCFRHFTSIVALTQHCESQSGRCQFRESEDYLPFINILSAGVADVDGRHNDMTLSYAVKPAAAKDLLQDEVYQRIRPLW